MGKRISRKVVSKANKSVDYLNNKVGNFKTNFRGFSNKKKTIYVVILLLIIPFIIGLVTFSRYVIGAIRENYFLSNDFYFYSDTLSTDNKVYEVSDWDGVSDYIVNVNVKNFIDDLRWTNKSINYNLDTTCDPNISGSVNCTNTNGVINYSSTGGTTNNLSITLSNVNGLTFEENDYVDMDVVVTSTSPYKKTLRATFRINVKPDAIKYSIKDKQSQKYFDLYLSNSTNTSKNVVLTWDKDVVSVDNTNSYIAGGSARTTTINSVTYVNGSTFSLEAKKSISIRFYKKDKTLNYTYPSDNNTSVIGVS